MDTDDDPAPAGGGDGTEKLRLKVAAGNAAGSIIEVADELLIGRQAEGLGSLAHDIEISRRHARIVSDAGGRYVIEDLGSTNGTYVNGRAVDSPVALEAGDRIEVGSSTLVVQVSAPPPTPRSTPVTTASALADAEAEEEVPVPDAGAPETAVEEAAEEDELPSEDELVEAGPELPPLSLTIKVDPEAGEVVVGLGEEGGEARFGYEDGAWRLKAL